MTLRLKSAVEEAFPAEWLAKVSPQRIGAGRGEAPAEWRTLLYVWPKPRATERYLIVATALLSDAQMAGSILFAPEREYWTPDGDHPSAPSRIWVISAAMRLAKSIEIHVAMSTLAPLSTNLGPAYKQFLGGRSIEESCALCQIDPKALEDFVRERLLKTGLNHEGRAND